MNSISGRILAIDYGTKRIGVAISDPMGIIAQGLPTIVYTDLSGALSKIENLISEFNVCEIVVGNPLSLSGKLNKTVNKINRFIHLLKNNISLPILSWDERFTSKQSERALKEMGKSPSKNRAKIDQLSASFILQSYLDNRYLKKTE